MTTRTGYTSLPPPPTDAPVTRISTDGARLLAYTERGVYAWDEATGAWSAVDAGAWSESATPDNGAASLTYRYTLSWKPADEGKP